jgi:hypothetical protein
MRFYWDQGFARVDADDESTLRCPCGSQFTWSWVDERLKPWLEEHRPHVPVPTAGLVTGG